MLMLAVPGRAADPLASLQDKIFAALKRQNAISSGRQLVSATYVCSLVFGGKSWPVVNTIEQVRGAQVPRGVNHIVVLDQQLKVNKKIPYDEQFPLFCKGRQLFVQGDLGIDNTAPYGNVLSFSDAGDVSITSLDSNDLPIPPTAQRKTYQMK